MHWRQVGWVGDTLDKLGPHLYADADFAGCPRTFRSIYGYYLSVDGPNTSMPQTAASARQTALSSSTPEAEFAACHLAHKKVFLPPLDIFDVFLPQGYHKTVHEDNQAMIQIVTTGINKTMRWLSRNHAIAVRYLYDHLGDKDRRDDTRLVYTRSEWMSADIFTKAFGDKEKWRAALELVRIIGPENIMQMISNRTNMFAQMSNDAKLHLFNTRPQDGSARHHSNCLKSQQPVPYTKTCPFGSLSQ